MHDVLGESKSVCPSIHPSISNLSHVCPSVHPSACLSACLVQNPDVQRKPNFFFAPLSQLSVSLQPLSSLRTSLPEPGSRRLACLSVALRLDGRVRRSFCLTLLTDRASLSFADAMVLLMEPVPVAVSGPGCLDLPILGDLFCLLSCCGLASNIADPVLSFLLLPKGLTSTTAVACMPLRSVLLRGLELVNTTFLLAFEGRFCFLTPCLAISVLSLTLAVCLAFNALSDLMPDLAQSASRNLKYLVPAYKHTIHFVSISKYKAL
jgi:hypothetical protein